MPNSNPVPQAGLSSLRVSARGGMLHARIGVAMVQDGRNIHALCLLTGSLDSQLAARVLQEQAIHVAGLVFTAPVFDTGAAEDAAGRLGISLARVDFTADLAGLLQDWSDRDGGDGCPCGACRGAMLKRAAGIMKEQGCHFIATGEVVGQHGTAQDSGTLEHIARHSGCDGLVVRPLSGNLLAETLPERWGWLDRSRLHAFTGKCRGQIEELAGTYGLCEYPQRSGLCRMKEPAVQARLRDVLRHEGIQGTRAMKLLCLGRHFRLGPGTRLIVGRNESENAELEGAAELYDLVLKPENGRGPTGLLPFTASEREVEAAAAVCARYADAQGGARTRVRVRSPRLTRWVDAVAADDDTIGRLRIE